MLEIDVCEAAFLSICQICNTRKKRSTKSEDLWLLEIWQFILYI